MALVLSIPILGVLAILQSVIFSSLPLLLGMPDLVLITILAWAFQERVATYWQWSLLAGLMMSFISGMPLGVYLVAYLLSTLVARLILRKVWKRPFLGMLTVTFVGTLILQAGSWIARWLTGVFIPLDKVMNLIVIPSVLLNLIIAIPAYFLMRDMAGWLYPEDVMV